jgi:hypothetical protein
MPCFSGHRKGCAMQEQRHAKWCSLVTLVMCWLLDFLDIQTDSMLCGTRVISQAHCVWKLSTAPLEFSSLTMIMTLGWCSLQARWVMQLYMCIKWITILWLSFYISTFLWWNICEFSLRLHSHSFPAETLYAFPVVNTYVLPLPSPLIWLCQQC